ncbi:protein NLRC5 isoform X2 [Pseudophryne corroboree]|uniref:protein NLRC5 isoform X2 n=1 Tax=Pseudophryne corroboree TaxID=495146 RepID=UPI0030817EBE
MEDMDTQDEMENVIPELVDFLCQDVDWLVGKVQALLPDTDLQPILQRADERGRVSALIQMLRKLHVKVWKALIDCICMECPLPMELEVQLLSLTGQGSGEVSLRSSLSNEDSRERRKQESAERYKEQIRCSLLEKYGFKVAGDPKGQFHPMFIDPLIKEIKMSKDHSRRKGDADRSSATEDSFDTVKIINLFKRTSLKKTHVILLVGMPGTGKTMLTHRICYEWARGQFSQFTLIFLFEFRQLNLISKHFCLRELLFNLFLMPELDSEEVFEYVLQNPQKVLIIFDGLDEFNGQFANSPLNINPDIGQITTTCQLFSCIFYGAVLRGCTVVVTCRSKILNSLPLDSVNRVADVLGFDKERVEQYVVDFFHTSALKGKVLFHLRDNKKLLHMCFVPALCHIVCVCLEHLLHTSSVKSGLPQTITQFYVEMLKIFIRKRLTSLADEATTLKTFRPLIYDLSELALIGIDKNKTVFYVGEVSAELQGFATAHGLLSMFDVKKFEGDKDVGYSFVHLSAQEFFAALHLMINETVTETTLHKRLSLKSKWNLKHKTKDELTDNFHIFLSGLASVDCRTFLYELTQQSENLIQTKQKKILESLVRLADTQLTGPKVIELCHCAYETQDENLAQKVGKHLAQKYELKNFRITPVDMTALMFVVKHGSCLVSLDFAGCPMELDCLEILGACHNIQSLSFRNRKYGDAFAYALSPVISDMEYLRKIRLTTGRLTAGGVAVLMKSFLGCMALQEIHLQNNHLKTEDMVTFVSLFSKMEHLKLLDLSHNEIQVTGVLTLIKAAVMCPSTDNVQITGDTAAIIFSSENCRPESSPQLKKARNEVTGMRKKRLSLQNCNLTPEHVPLLLELLTGSQLSHLNLSGNPLGDGGCKLLIEGLPNIPISGELELNKTQLSEEGIFHLVCSMLSCLNVKHIFVSGIQQTAEIGFSTGSDDGHRDIRITGFKYYRRGLEKLCAILQQCSKLAHLDLSDNSLQNAEICQVTQILPELKRLRSVNLSGNGISLGGIIHLATSLSVVENLADVTISFGSRQIVLLTLQDSSREESFLVHNENTSAPPQSPKAFSLTGYSMTSRKLQSLLQVLVQCSALTQINLSGNALSYHMMESLLTHLPHFHNLTFLNISKSDLSPDCVLLLADSINLCDRITEVDVRSAEDMCLHLQRQHKASKVICRLNNCKISRKDVTPLLTAFQRNPNLLEVSMCINHLSEDGVLVLLSTLSSWRNVAEINVCLNPKETIHVVFSPSGDSLRKIRLNGCNFQAEHHSKLWAVLENSYNITHFISKRNNIALDDVKDCLSVQSQISHDFTLSIDEPWVGGENLMSLVHHITQTPANIKGISICENKVTIKLNGWVDSKDRSKGSHFQALRSLRFNLCGLEIYNLDCLNPVIKNGTCLTELNLSHNCLGDRGVQIVAGFLGSLPALKMIKLASTQMSHVGLTALTDSLIHCKSVQNIDVSSNCVGEEGALSCTHLLTQKRNLNVINVSGCFLVTSAGGRQFIAELSQCPELQEIHLQSMALDDATLPTLFQGFPQASLIRKLMLGNNNITHAGVYYLAESLARCTNMESMDLSGIRFETEAIVCLAKVLPQMPQLKALSLGSCGLGECSESSFVELLVSLPQLEDISLSNNTFSEHDLLRLTDGLLHFKLLKKIKLSWNRIGDGGARALSAALKHTRKLKTLDLERNQIREHGAEAVAQALSVCLWIKVVRLWHNQVSKEIENMLQKENPRLRFH